MTQFHYEQDEQGIVTVAMDMLGSVNALNEDYAMAMTSTLERLEAESALSGVILTSAKKTFFAGGDLHELLAVKAGDEDTFFTNLERVKSLQRRLEKLPVPVVAAINGSALGSGFEIALSCHYRIAVNDPGLKLGFPEVTLGLIPGAGGVVRLTQRLGLQAALPYLINGKLINAAEAKQAKLVDSLVESQDQLISSAKQWILDNHKTPEAKTQPWDRTDFTIPGGNADQLSGFIQSTAVSLYKKYRGLLLAPSKILDTAVQALRLDIDSALTVESRQFTSLVVSAETKNMIRANFFQMNEVNGGASRPQGINKTTIKKLGVIGAGMMGQGIAFVAAKAGIEVVLKDMSLAAAQQGKAYSAEVSDQQITRGQMTEAEKQAVSHLITPTDQDKDLQGCDLMIEAVFENMPLKQKIIQANEGALVEGGVWATNTSTLPISQLAEASDKQANFIGIHFFSPVDRMRLVEIICGKNTADTTLAKAFDFVQQINKTPIVVNDSLGFFTSRVFGMPLNEGVAMVAEGVHPARIENLGKALGMPVGPLASFDEVSLRLALEIRDTQQAMGLSTPDQDPTPTSTQLLRTLFNDHGRGGRRFGGGFYDYGDQGKTLWPTLVKLYYNPVTDNTISDEDIKDRLLFRGVIESMKCLEEGVLRSVPDGNIGSLLGIGAPGWTGGYIQFVNTYGLQRFIDRCTELATNYGERFSAPNIVHEKLAKGGCFE